MIKHKKNYSISTSCYNTQRNNKDYRFNVKNKNNKNNYLYSPKKNKIENKINNKSILVPEYKVKLDIIKSRVTDLLNIYSLLALRSINNSNEIIENNNEQDKEIKDENQVNGNEI